MMKSRKERRAEARQNKVPFVPQYNGRGPVPKRKSVEKEEE